MSDRRAPWGTCAPRGRPAWLGRPSAGRTHRLDPLVPRLRKAIHTVVPSANGRAICPWPPSTAFPIPSSHRPLHFD